jgi:hypothetical protein
MANVTFYENKNCEKKDSYHDYYIPSGQTALYIDLDNSDHDSYWQPNDKHKMNNDTESISVSSGYYLIVFSSTNYYYNSDFFAKMDKSSDDLSDTSAFRGRKDMYKDIGSFILYDKEPIHWELNKSDRRSSGVYAKFFSDYGYNEDIGVPPSEGNLCNDSSIRVVNFVYGEGHIQTGSYLNNLLYSVVVMGFESSQTENYELFSLKSLITGPSTWIQLFKDIHYGGDSICINPNSFIPNTDDLFDSTDPIGSSFNSIKIFSQEPADWIPSGDPLVDPYLELAYQRFETGTALVQCGITMLGILPIPGSDAVSGLCWIFYYAFWPDGNPYNQDVWNEISVYSKSILKDYIDQYALDYMASQLTNFGSRLNGIYLDKPTQERLNSIVSLRDDLTDDNGFFVGDITTDAPTTQLTYQIAFTSLGLILRWLLVNEYEDVSGEEDDPNQASHASTLDDTVDFYLKAIKTTVQNCLDWRTSSDMLIPGKMSTDHDKYQIVDKYNGLIYPELDEDEVDSKMSSLTSYIQTNFGYELSLYTLPSKYYRYLKTTNTEKPVYSPMDYPVALGTRSGDTQQVSLGDKKITQITMYGGGENSRQYVNGIKFYFDDGTNFQIGSVLSDYTVSSTIDEDEQLTVCYGRNGSWMDQLHIQTDKGLDLGLGGGGGDPFLLRTPVGVGYNTVAILESIEGESYNGYVSFLQFNYSIQQPTATS